MILAPEHEFSREVVVARNVRVLNISSWYPSQDSKFDGVFIKEQFEIFSSVTDSRMLHVQVLKSARLLPRFKRTKISGSEFSYVLLVPAKSDFIVEVLTACLLAIVLLIERPNRYDCVNFHIAYPLLCFYPFWKLLIHVPVFISEHWSAYHFNFFLPKATNKLGRIKRIFGKKIPVVTVSEALMKDIQTFSGFSDFPGYVLPNIVRQEFFDSDRPRSGAEVPRFFVVNVWRSVKNPYPMLEAFSVLAQSAQPFTITIGGDGPILAEMKAEVKRFGLCARVEFLGSMSPAEIAQVLRKSDAYLFSSTYETFSVACAQALCSGVPLIGPFIPAVCEYAGVEDMVVVEGGDVAGWEAALRSFLGDSSRFKSDEIAKRAESKFSHDVVRRRYLDILSEVTMKESA